jgi:hypothetical protein
LVFRLDVFGRVGSKYFVIPAIDTAKSKDVALGISGIHGKTPESGRTYSY